MKLNYLILFLLCFGCKSETKTTEEKKDQFKIVYNVLFDEDHDNYEVFVMDMDGVNKTNISNFEGVEWTYHSSGEKVYFITDKDTAKRHYQLYKMKADGSNKTKISELRLADSWHSTRKNGTEIIVRPHRSVDTAFYILDEAGNIIKKLKPNVAYLSDPLFSPDGKSVVFRGANAPFKKDSGYLDELYIMNDEGSELRQLTHYPKADTTAKWHNYHASPPKWHPTENFISYGSFQNGKYSLFAVTPDGQRQWKLLPDSKKSSTVWHDWSPDGKWLVYDVSYNREPPYHIELMNWETKETKVLTDSTYQYHQAPNFVKIYD